MANHSIAHTHTNTHAQRAQQNSYIALLCVQVSLEFQLILSTGFGRVLEFFLTVLAFKRAHNCLFVSVWLQTVRQVRNARRLNSHSNHYSECARTDPQNCAIETQTAPNRFARLARLRNQRKLRSSLFAGQASKSNVNQATFAATSRRKLTWLAYRANLLLLLARHGNCCRRSICCGRPSKSQLS